MLDSLPTIFNSSLIKPYHGYLSEGPKLIVPYKSYYGQKV